MQHSTRSNPWDGGTVIQSRDLVPNEMAGLNIPSQGNSPVILRTPAWTIGTCVLTYHGRHIDHVHPRAVSAPRGLTSQVWMEE